MLWERQCTVRGSMTLAITVGSGSQRRLGCSVRGTRWIDLTASAAVPRRSLVQQSFATQRSPRWLVSLADWENQNLVILGRCVYSVPAGRPWNHDFFIVRTSTATREANLLLSLARPKNPRPVGSNLVLARYLEAHVAEPEPVRKPRSNLDGCKLINTLTWTKVEKPLGFWIRLVVKISAPWPAVNLVDNSSRYTQG